jgi:hypothetical protein
VQRPSKTLSGNQEEVEAAVLGVSLCDVFGIVNDHMFCTTMPVEFFDRYSRTALEVTSRWSEVSPVVRRHIDRFVRWLDTKV